MIIKLDIIIGPGSFSLGESYVPLREMFENACSDENEKVKNIMIICGRRGRKSYFV